METKYIALAILVVVVVVVGGIAAWQMGKKPPAPELEKTEEIKNIMQKLPDYYPDDYWKTIARAKEEGKLKVYTAHFGTLAESIVEDFNGLYPFIKADIVTLPTAKVYERFSMEAAEGQWTPDVVHTYDGPALFKLNGAGYFMNYDSPETPYYSEESVSEDNTVIAPNYNPYVSAWNPQKFEGEPPKSLVDLANAISENPSEWEGQLAVYDGMMSTSAWQQMYIYAKFYGEDRMYNLYENLALAKPKSFWSTSTMGKWVAKGQVKFGLNLAQFILKPYVRPSYSEEVLQWGVPEDVITNTFLGGYEISAKPKHPNAAKLFFDYYYSKRGQLYLVNNWNIVSTRTDITSADVTADLVGHVMTHEKMSELTGEEYVTTYDSMSRAGAKKSEYKSEWYKIFVS